MVRRAPAVVTAPRSLWQDTLPGAGARPPLDGPAEADVAIVGGGYTGLWTAYYLARRDPSLRIVVLEREVAGFGASGRNGGWLSNLLPIGWEQIAAQTSREAAVAWQRCADATVDEVLAITRAEGIDAQAAKGGFLQLATTEVQAGRLRAEVDRAREWGFGPADLRWLSRAEARGRVAADRVFGGTWTPHCAAVHPARLVRGLADAVERRGVTIHEGTPVTEIAPHAARTPRGDVRARVVVRALEGYTAGLPSSRRDLLPLYSLMLATEPLPEEFWAEVGWSARETLSDARRLVIYAQRTADGRIAMGGRGAPYRLGSRIRRAHEQARGVHELIRHSLVELFPALADARITHRWGGVLGVPRDWWPSVHLDPATGLARAGGYAGDGVAMANLAGRTLADLITGRDTALTRLPFVGHRSPRFEPEPLRWLGVNTGLHLAAAIDERERRTGRPAAVLDRIMTRLTGH
jgi:glycine/D-amino acid oxidase-like deaminating enzyme